MTGQPKGDKIDQGQIIDPLRRVFVPIEKRDVRGNWVFQTLDKQKYIRNAATGQIRTLTRKVNGKVARKVRAKQRRAVVGQL